MALELQEASEIARRTLLVAGVATAGALLPGLGLALLLARKRFPGRTLLQAIVTIPMVVPPVAVGLLLLKALSPRQPWAEALYATMGGNPLFTWRAAALASAVMGAPLLVRGAEAAFASVPRRLELLAASLGASRWRIFCTVTLPLAGRGVAYGCLLCFLRAMGEFGATILVAGNIPGRTETLSSAIYSRTQAQRDDEAMLLALPAIGLAILATMLGEALSRRGRSVRS